MEDVIRLHDQYYILATSSRADERTRVLKQGDTFAIFDHFGDVVPFGLGEQGIYHHGTRHLSRLELRLNGARPLLLSSSVLQENDLFVADLTNPDIPLDRATVFRRDVLHVFRAKFLWNGASYERLRLTNHGLTPVTLSLSIRFEADFRDIFEVRGTSRPRRGRMLDSVNGGDTLVLGYEGLDGVVRRTAIECSPAPQAIVRDEMQFTLALEPQEAATIQFTIRCNTSDNAAASSSYEDGHRALCAGIGARGRQRGRIVTGNEQFNDWIGRSTADLEMMLTVTPHGVYPYAGVPWFSTPFGRDGIITALELLWIDPDIARGVLTYLAATQATELNREQDAEPGKILHETRGGEMAALGE
ncbi:MAG: glycogen debranching N-terminal domain-containing protein, partial [Burkholderiales bacterium]